MLLLMERATGIEPAYQPWQGRVLPLNYARILPNSSSAYLLKHIKNTYSRVLLKKIRKK